MKKIWRINRLDTSNKKFKSVEDKVWPPRCVFLWGFYSGNIKILTDWQRQMNMKCRLNFIYIPKNIMSPNFEISHNDDDDDDKKEKHSFLVPNNFKNQSKTKQTSISISYRFSELIRKENWFFVSLFLVALSFDKAIMGRNWDVIQIFSTLWISYFKMCYFQFGSSFMFIYDKR